MNVRLVRQSVVLALLGSMPPAGLAQTVFNVTDFGATPNNSSDDDGTPIRDALDAAMSTSGDVTVFIPDGIYHVKSSASPTDLHVFKIPASTGGVFLPDSLTILGDVGTPKIILQHTTNNGMRDKGLLFAEDVANLSVVNLKTDHMTTANKPSTFTQGVIVGEDPNHKYTDIAITQGYAGPDTGVYSPGFAFSRIIDPLSRELVPGCANRVINEIEFFPPQPNQAPFFRLHHQVVHPSNDEAAIDDLLALPRPQTGTGPMIQLRSTPNCLLQDLTIFASPSMAVNTANAEDLTVERVRVVPGAKPPLAPAGEDRLISSTRDGIHVTASRGVVRVEDCEVRHTGDDAIALHGKILELVNSVTQSTQIEVSTATGEPQVGDRLRAFDEGSETITELVVVGVEDVMMGGVADWKLTLREPVTLTNPTGGMPIQMQNEDMLGSGFVLRGNQCSNISGRGLIVKASDGVIEGNTTYDTHGPGISVLSVLYNMTQSGLVSDGGGSFSSIRIRDNVIRRAAVSEGPNDFFRGGISVYHRPPTQNWEAPTLFREVLIHDNAGRPHSTGSLCGIRYRTR